MLRKTTLIMSLALLGGALWAAESALDSADWIPQDAIITVEYGDPADLLELVLGPKIEKAVTSSPVYQGKLSDPGFKEFQGVVAFVETVIGKDWRAATREVLGGGVMLGVLPEDTFLLIVKARDGELLGQLHELFAGFARDGAAKEGEPGRVRSEEYRAEEIWTFGGDEWHAIVDNHLLFSNRQETIQAALNLRADVDGKGLTDLSTYIEAKNSVETGSDATAVVRLDMLKQNPEFQNGLTQGLNPLLSLLLADVPDALLQSDWLSLGLDVDRETLSLRAFLDGKRSPSGPAMFSIPDDLAKGVFPNLDVPRRIAAVSLYRDLHGFYAAKDELFPERTSGLIFFENMMGIFFTGRDLTEEVLGETEPEIRIVAAAQAYDDSVGTPKVQIPSFAVVFRMREPEKFGVVAEEAWQKAIGLVNFTRGQQAQPGLIIDRPVHADTKFTMAYFAPVEDEDKTALEIRHNYRPSVATFGEYLILSSTDGLTKDLMDTLKQEMASTVEPSAEIHSALKVDGSQLASILAANQENMIRQNMVEKGHSREQAEAEVQMLTTIIRYLGDATLTIGADQERSSASLVFTLNLP